MLKSEKENETNSSLEDWEDFCLGTAPDYKEEIEIEKAKNFQEAIHVFDLQTDPKDYDALPGTKERLETWKKYGRNYEN